MNKKETKNDVGKDDVLNDRFKKLFNTLGSLKSQITMTLHQVRGLEKIVNKKIRVLERKINKNKNKGSRQPSGFALPTKISNELCEFMNEPHGVSMARTEVTQYIIQYIKNKNLQDKSNGRKIKPDNALKTLLNMKQTDDLTYFNLQKYMNQHFVKEHNNIL
jgi:chromatin remodeling complex protein RSC6